MGVPEIPKKVKLIAAITVQKENQLPDVEEFLKENFGAIDHRSPVFPFTYTDYYEEEMGKGLFKVFFSFKRLISRETLPAAKHLTNEFEQKNGVDGKRTINIDPGYIGEANLVLATTKNFSHRIYIGDGIYADCHLVYEKEKFQPLPWTYPDFESKEASEFLVHTRKIYYQQLDEEGSFQTVTYKDAGVDIDEGERAIQMIKEKVKRTYGKNVLTELGKFGGFYAPDWQEFDEPVLVSSVDGVGTKLKIAFMSGVHDTVGQCLVNHCIDDILCCGAKPMFFLDYLAFGKLEAEMFAGVVSGLAKACEEAGCALIGGETAEMPGFYKEGEYDISGTIVGIAEKSKIIDGSKIQEGDIILGLPSAGLHTNGYSLARKIFFEAAGLDVDSYLQELGCTVGEELLKVHRCYFKEIYPLIQEDLANGLAHITGGGMLGNINRLLGGVLKAEIDWNSWEWLPVFKTMQKLGNVSDAEMRHVFNLGIGITVIASPDKASVIKSRFEENGTEYYEIGRIAKA
ncbi:phosphoribosylformylglycinamidine cyclo-ligase [candidate division KSB1 bacterium]